MRLVILLNSWLEKMWDILPISGLLAIAGISSETNLLFKVLA
jgi:hypothetical protein